MCEKAVEKDSRALHCVPYQFKIQEICEKAVEKDSRALQDDMSHIILRLKKCVRELLKKAHWHWNLSQIILRLRRGVKKLKKNAYGN